MNTLMLLDATSNICGGGGKDLSPVFGVIGYVLIGIKIIVPILLILFGMLDLTKAVAGGDQKKVKEATTSLIWKIVAAVTVFLVITLVTFLMSVIGDNSWKKCGTCLNDPTKAQCSFKLNVGD